MTNEDIKIAEIQDNRIWVHSEKLGYGCWIRNSLFRILIRNQKDHSKIIEIIENGKRTRRKEKEKL